MFNNLILTLSNQRHLRAIQQSLLLNMPIMVIGSFAAVFINLPLTEYQNLMNSLLGANWKLLGTSIYSASFGIISLLLAGTISYLLAEHQEGFHPLVASITAISCLTILIQPESTQGFLGLPAHWLGIFGIFFSIIVTLLVTEIFFFIRSLELIKLEAFFDNHDPLIAQSLTNIIPFGITLAIFAIIKYISLAYGIVDICQPFYNLIKSLFTVGDSSLFAVLKYYFVVQILWFFGIHGQNVLSSVLDDLYKVAAQQNLLTYSTGGQPTEIITNVFITTFATIGGTGSTLCLILAILFTYRQGIPYRLAQISVLPAIFNVSEILIFGLPIALNPIFLLPFILTPLVLLCVAYLATLIGLVPITNNIIHWTTPPLLSGYLATNSFSGILLQCVNLGIGFAIYLPFVKISKRQKQQELEKSLTYLSELASVPKNMYSTNLISRGDNAGKLARLLAHDLKEAMEQKTLYLEYQPQVYQGKTVTGVEALLRWNHYSLGKIPPSLVIMLAEETGLIHSLGGWVLATACQQLATWKKAGLEDVVMSVNISVKQLTKDKILEDVAKSIATSGINPYELELEITESIALDNNHYTQKRLQTLTTLGVKIAIDDFGMGHSSLSYIKNFPINTLKIDQSLSRDITYNLHSRKMVTSIIEMCASLNLKVIVEYIDKIEQQLLLDELGDVHCQGYLYSPSLSPDRALSYIQNMNNKK